MGDAGARTGGGQSLGVMGHETRKSFVAAEQLRAKLVTANHGKEHPYQGLRTSFTGTTGIWSVGSNCPQA